MGKIIAICGKICSGKTYYANQIREKENAIILSTDEVTYDLTNNKQGENYEEFANRVNNYLKKKSVELVDIGCNVILDWGFWTAINRKATTDYYKSHDINIEWHYIDIDEESWYKNIEERNKKVLEGKGKFDFYVDEGLLKKILSKFEIPDRNEIDFWYTFKREV